MDKFVSPCPKPTEFEAELLHKLIEECSEVTKRATKALRFGLDEVQPGQSLNNVERLREEIVDLIVAYNALSVIGMINVSVTREEYYQRIERLKKYLQADIPEGVYL